MTSKHVWASVCQISEMLQETYLQNYSAVKSFRQFAKLPEKLCASAPRTKAVLNEKVVTPNVDLI